jgi:hypothetical protein
MYQQLLKHNAADDTNLFFNHQQHSEMTYFINGEMVKTSRWFKINKSPLNIGHVNNHTLDRCRSRLQIFPEARFFCHTPFHSERALKMINVKNLPV